MARKTIEHITDDLDGSLTVGALPLRITQRLFGEALTPSSAEFVVTVADATLTTHVSRVRRCM